MNTSNDKAAAMQHITDLIAKGFETNIKYSVGLLSVPQEGVISWDGNSIVELVDSTTNKVVFSIPIDSIGKVTRMEYAIYMNIPGMKKVAIMFGDALKYLTKNAATMPFGITGAATGLRSSNKMNIENGLVFWLLLFKQKGKIRNVSPNAVLAFAVIGGIVITVVSFAIYVWMQQV